MQYALKIIKKMEQISENIQKLVHSLREVTKFNACRGKQKIVLCFAPI